MIELHNADCLEAMRLIEGGSIDAIITDPPYGRTACNWDTVIPFAFIELDPDYYSAACKRLKQHQKQLRMF